VELKEVGGAALVATGEQKQYCSCNFYGLSLGCIQCLAI
jgi:hypothetical protein